jgi:hypothetical protein
MILRRNKNPITTFESWRKEILSEIDIVLPLSDNPKDTQIAWQKQLSDYFGGTTYMPNLKIYSNPLDTQLAWQKELMYAFN